MHPSLHSFPIYMRGPGCGWGKMCDVLAAWVKRGFRLSGAQWVDLIVLPSVIMTWGVCFIGCLLIHGVFTLMQF